MTHPEDDLHRALLARLNFLLNLGASFWVGKLVEPKGIEPLTS
jgi:hypothetical protein